MNSLPNGYKRFHFNLTMSKLKIKQKQPTAYTAVCSVEPVVPDFRRMSFNFRFFPYLLENSFSTLMTETLLYFLGLISKIEIQTQCG